MYRYIEMCIYFFKSAMACRKIKWTFKIFVEKLLFLENFVQVEKAENFRFFQALGQADFF